MYYSEHKMLRQMQECIDCLEKENRYLKDLLDRAGISYEQTPNENQTQEDTFDRTREPEYSMWKSRTNWRTVSFPDFGDGRTYTVSAM